MSGAAATNATLAWLGGGSLAAGGAGMVGGALVLGGIGAPIALLGGGLLYAHKASKTLTDAVQYEADVDEFVANSKIIKTHLGGMELRVKELLLVTVKLESRLKKLVEDFKSEYPDKNYPFFLKFLLKIKNNRMEKSQKNKLIMIGMLVDTLNLVLTAPLLNDGGKASDESLIAIEKAEYLIKDV